MKLRLFTYSILLFLLVVVPLFLYVVGHSSGVFGASDPVTADTTIPPTLQVTVTVAEDQEASDGQYGVEITLAFKTNEVIPPDTANFMNGESASCNGSQMRPLANATSYWFRVPINSSYTCKYSYHNLKGQPETATIFSFEAAQEPLSPVLHRPVNNSTFKVSYTPGNPSPNTKTCTVQVTANAPGGSVTGDPMQQNGSYTGPNVGSLNGLGNIMMTRTCKPICFDNHNKADDNGLNFDAVCVTYMSTASDEVSWYSQGSPTQGTIP